MHIRTQIEFIVEQNVEREYLLNATDFQYELEELKNQLFNSEKDNDYEFDGDDLIDILPDLFECYGGMDMTNEIIAELKNRNFDKLYNLYGLTQFDNIIIDLTEKAELELENIKKDFEELFENTGENIYFRNTNNSCSTTINAVNIDITAIKERFEKESNKNIFAYIYTEDATNNPNLEYYTAYYGSEEFCKLLRKYNLMFKWETKCVASLYFDKEEEESDEEN